MTIPVPATTETRKDAGPMSARPPASFNGVSFQRPLGGIGDHDYWLVKDGRKIGEVAWRVGFDLSSGRRSRRNVYTARVGRAEAKAYSEATFLRRLAKLLP